MVGKSIIRAVCGDEEDLSRIENRPQKTTPLSFGHKYLKAIEENMFLSILLDERVL